MHNATEQIIEGIGKTIMQLINTIKESKANILLKIDLEHPVNKLEQENAFSKTK